MNPFSPNVTNLHDDAFERTQLGQMCGSKLIFSDRYEILRVLGRGGFGITFLARDVVLPGNPLCVIKQLYPKTITAKSWQKACQRFEKEAKTLAQLGGHSQIPMLLDYFQQNGEFYLVQEYIPGHTLAREIRKNGPKSEAEVRQFLKDILPVLRYIHQNHVIHRDIKPQNLLRCADDKRLVLIDFGAVKEKLIDVSGNSLNRSKSTNFIGTAGFAPPEQLSLRPVYASDIYALGVTCLYLLTGKGPLSFNYHPQTGDLNWQNEVKISHHFAEILAKMIKLNLEERFKTVGQIMMAFGWDNDLGNLSQCLTQQPPSLKNQTDQSQSSVYKSPSAKTAIAIRQLQSRLNQRTNKPTDFYPL
ncbi:MAG TPA: serine/threonine-protein kinase [Nostocaceae cyanobacterium]|nr:serine/threonine-protein kinase [Nostocaceae cyanobacterium]